MHNKSFISRRRILKSAATVSGLAVASPVLAAIPSFTPNQVMGPFYPVEKPLDQDADLTVIAGKGDRAEGRILHLIGRVLDSRGRPVPGAKIEIWQANTHGRYTHPADGNPAPLDPNFEGFGVQVSDDEGRYRFKTIKPGAYPVSQDWMRPPHIHVDVIGRTGRILTQIYFENEPLNDVDKLLQGTPNSEALIAKYQEPGEGIEDGALVAYWDVMLPET
ncbi:MAG: protocatechuate 3,4-dioxygenase [Kiloniellales bacterium]|nr:protocatechuate 3,4-dioxygenase [Kiloniellales bacterium]